MLGPEGTAMAAQVFGFDTNHDIPGMVQKVLDEAEEDSDEELEGGSETE